MRVVQCTNGHFFDADSYENCSECGAKEKSAESNFTVSKGKKVKTGGFSKWIKKKNEVPATGVKKGCDIKSPVIEPPAAIISADPVKKGYINVLGNNNMTDVNDVEPEEKAEIRKTVGFWEQSPGKKEVSEKTNLTNTEINAGLIHEPLGFDLPLNRDLQQEPESFELGLKDAVKVASASSEGKTISYFTSRVTSQSQQVSYAEPVTGWLVAVAGNHKGESFCVYSGNNSIGRNNTNRITLNKDSAVSRDNHAFVVFEPKKALFYFRPGEASGLSYINSEIVNSTVVIKSYDTIEIGETKLLFIPLCGDCFSWDNYI